MSDSNLATLAQIAETSWGVSPSSPVYTLKRFTKQTMNYAKETVISGEIRPDRQIPDVIQVGYSALGGYEFEVSALDIQLLLQNAMFCTPLVINLPAISVVMGGNTITGSAGAFSAIVAQQRIRITLTTVNDGIWTVSSVSSNGASFTVAEGSLTSYTGTATFAATIFRNGIVRSSMAMELCPAPGNYINFTGMMVNTAKFTLEAKKIALGTVDFIGSIVSSGSSTKSTGGAYLPASTNPIMNCSSNVGRLWTNGAPFTTGIKMMTVEIQNMLRPQPQVGSLSLFGVGLGQFKVTGQLQLYFKDLTVYNEFIDHTPTSLSALLTDANGGGLSFTLPRVQFDTGKVDVPGVNTDIMEDFAYTATYDPVTGMTLQISEM